MSRIKLDNIQRDEKNFNKHTDKGMDLLKKSIEQVGIIESITVSSDNVIISGNARHEKITEKFGDSEAIVVETDGTRPVILKRTDISSGTREFHEAALLANTVSTKNMNLDTALIKDILVEEYNVNIEELGVEIVDVAHEIKEDNYIIPKQINTDIKYRDMFEIACGGIKHRLLCGDATKQEDIKLLLNGEKADMIFTAPPYEIENTVIYENIKCISNKTNILIFASDKQIPYIFNAKIGEFKRLYILDTNIASPTNNDVYVNHIALLRFKIGDVVKFNNIHDGGRSIIKMDYRKNLHEEIFHNHQKSQKILQLFIQYWSNEGQIIVDFFGGSGSTLIAAHQLSRKCYINEIEPKNCQIIIDRFKKTYENCNIHKLN